MGKTHKTNETKQIGICSGLSHREAPQCFQIKWNLEVSRHVVSVEVGKLKNLEKHLWRKARTNNKLNPLLMIETQATMVRGSCHHFTVHAPHKNILVLLGFETH